MNESLKTAGKAPAEAIKAQKSRVKLTLPLVPGVLSEDVQVIYNGKVYIIKRGKEVAVPVAVKEILDNQTAQLKNASEV